MPRKATGLSFEHLETRELLTTFYVSPSGNAANSGQSKDQAIVSVQQALNKAMPGDTVYLVSGTYNEDLKSVRNGRADAPITITGDANVVLKGVSNGRLFEVNHDYLTVKGFTIDGLHGSGNAMSDYSDKLLYAIGTSQHDGVTGLRVLNMTFKNSGGEAVRLRYYAQNNEIAYSTFLNVGIFDYKFKDGGKNGEAIYVGTSSEQWADGKNPTSGPDPSNNNWIHHNFMNTQGNEGVDIKEGSSGNIVEYNNVTGQLDPESGGLDSRGDGNIFRYNHVYGNAGAGIRLGGHLVNGVQYGKNNEVYGNYIHDNQTGGIKFQVEPQKAIHGNQMSGNRGGDAVGTFGKQYNPTSGQNLFPGVEKTGPNGSTPNPPTPDPTDPGPTDPGPTDPGPTDPGQTDPEPTDPDPPENPDPTPNTGEPLDVSNISATSHDGNRPENTRDQSLSTRWSAEGDGQSITYDLGQTKLVDGVGIAFYKGTDRVAYFHVEVSVDGVHWTKVYRGESSGRTNSVQKFSLSDAQARYVRIVGHRNEENDWNSFTQVEIYGASVAGPSEPTEPTEPPTGPSPTGEYLIAAEDYTRLQHGKAVRGNKSDDFGWLAVDQSAPGAQYDKYLRALRVRDSASTDAKNLNQPQGSFVEFDVEIESAGAYALSVHAAGYSTSSDSMWVEVADGNRLDGDGAVMLQTSTNRQFNWVSAGTWQLDAGVHTIRISMRESGAAFDAVRLAQQSSQATSALDLAHESSAAEVSRAAEIAEIAEVIAAESPAPRAPAARSSKQSLPVLVTSSASGATKALSSSSSKSSSKTAHVPASVPTSSVSVAPKTSKGLRLSSKVGL